MVGATGLFSIAAGLLNYNQALALRVALAPSDSQVLNSTVDLMAKLSIGMLCLGFVYLLISGAGFYIGRKSMCNPQADTLAELVRKQYRPQTMRRALPEATLVSIIIPSRVGETIHTIGSIERQTHKHLEVIIVYDYHGDGASATRNRGAERAAGSYLLFCDNDLDLAPDAIESMLTALDTNNADWVYGRAMIDGKIVTKDRPVKPPADTQSEEFVRYFKDIHTTSLIRSCLRPRFDENMLRFTDWDLWVRLAKAGYRHTFIDKVILKSENRPNCISTGAVGDWYLWEKVLYQKHGLIHD
jgi:hypothetical protein